MVIKKVELEVKQCDFCEAMSVSSIIEECCLCGKHICGNHRVRLELKKGLETVFSGYFCCNDAEEIIALFEQYFCK